MLVGLIPAPLELLEARDAVEARLRIAREPAAVRPRRAGLDRDDALRGLRDQLAVVRDEQHGLRRLAQRLLEPALAGHVEVVVGLVEQQHLVASAQQRLEGEPLLLAAREGADGSLAGGCEREAERLAAARLPERLGIPSADVAPARDRLGVGELRRLVRR